MTADNPAPYENAFDAYQAILDLFASEANDFKKVDADYNALFYAPELRETFLFTQTNQSDNESLHLATSLIAGSLLAHKYMLLTDLIPVYTDFMRDLRAKIQANKERPVAEFAHDSVLFEVPFDPNKPPVVVPLRDDVSDPVVQVKRIVLLALNPRDTSIPDKKTSSNILCWVALADGKILTYFGAIDFAEHSFGLVPVKSVEDIFKVFKEGLASFGEKAHTGIGKFAAFTLWTISLFFKQTIANTNSEKLNEAANE